MRIFSLAGLTAIIVCSLGLVVTGLGAWLVVVGGSAYYLAAGIGLLASGGLLLRGSRLGPWTYTLVLAGTLIWALSESGFDGWSLIPRLVAPAVLALWIWSPWVAGRLYRNVAISGTAARIGNLAFALLILVLVFGSGYWITQARTTVLSETKGWTAAAGLEDDSVSGDAWQFYGRTPAGDRFSPLDQIAANNVKDLKQAWSFSTGDLPKPGENANGREFSFEATPIKVGDNLYFCTPHREVVALNATTGQQKWRYNPAGDISHNIYQACRGVSYYDASATPDASGACSTRIISTASDLPRLFELDAQTGEPCEAFGEHGMVDLREHMGPVPPGFHFISSPPLVLNGKIVLGGWVYDNQTVGEPSGVIRAFDANTGALAWSWDMGKTPANKKLEPDETYTRGTPNGWGVYTADPKLNLVFVPLGNATPDYFGGERRPFDDQYSSSLVALDLTTGQERWHFQTVHHDLWDFDLPVGPSLVNLPGENGDTIPAIVQTSKQGQLFLLDRRDGHPLADVKEKPVPQGDIPGERYSPTQPFSTGMPQMLAPKLTEADMWGATPIDQLLCRITFHRMRDDGLFTPPGEKPTIGWPAFDGTSDWYGATIDPERKLLYLNTTFMPFQLQMLPYKAALDKGLFNPWGGWSEPLSATQISEQPAARDTVLDCREAVAERSWHPMHAPAMGPDAGHRSADEENCLAAADRHNARYGAFRVKGAVRAPNWRFQHGRQYRDTQRIGLSGCDD